MNKKKIFSFVVAILLGVSAIFPQLPAPVHAASSSEIKWQINQLKKEQKEIQEKIEEVRLQQTEAQDEIAVVLNEKSIIDQELQLIDEQIANMYEQIKSYNLLIADTQDELDKLNTELEELRVQNKARIRNMEENHTISYWNIIFKSNSFSDLLDRLVIIEEIAAADKKLLDKLSEAATSVEETKQALNKEKAEFESIKNELEDAEAKQLDKRKESDALIQELLSKIEDLEALEEEFEKQEREFLSQIAAKEDDLNEAKRQEWLAYMETYVPPTTEAPKKEESPDKGDDDNNQENSESWIKPCNYTSITSPFGYRVSPTAGASTYHQGVDLDINTGDPIYAARSGVVSYAGYGNAAGNWIKINHMDGFSSVYMHLDSICVKNGEIVRRGQMIGRGGNTGVSTGSHLHFGIMLNGTYVNPAKYIAL